MIKISTIAKVFFICVLCSVFCAFVVFAVVPHRIISTMPSITETLFALGLGKEIVGVTTNCNYPAAAQKKTKIGGFFLNTEKIFALKPDLLVMMKNSQPRDVERLKKMNFNVYAINPHTIKDVLASITEIGKVTDRNEEASDLVWQLQRRLNAIKPKTWGIDFVLGRPRTIVVVGYEPLIVAGKGTVIDDVLRLAGAENIAADSRSQYPQYSMEKLVEKDPDALIIMKGTVTLEMIKRAGQWQKISAIKNNRLLFIDPDILSRPGPRIVDALEQIAVFLSKSSQ
ncbi:cobalamin-binding protein [Candidatus Saganbacteria bacterium]|nr:cobalamin-binding protein [Candidatus Saganbacteria bacterium]